jgi:hypothetical protein
MFKFKKNLLSLLIIFTFLGGGKPLCLATDLTPSLTKKREEAQHESSKDSGKRKHPTFPTIIVAEDNPVERLILEKILSLWEGKVNILFAKDGEEGLST